MPKFHFYATQEDSLRMLRGLFARGDLRAIVREDHLVEPSAPVHTTFTHDLEQELRQEHKAHLYGSFSTHAPLFTESTIDGTYFLSDTGGGPKVLYRLASVLEGVLTRGNLWTQPRYELAPGQLAGPSPALKAAYADMVKRLKKHLVRWEGLWITPRALELLKEGEIQLPGDLQRLGALARAAKTLPQLKPVPPSSAKTTKRKVAAKTASP